MRHVSLTVDTEEIEPVIHVQTHGYNRVWAPTRAITPGVVLRTVLLLILLHHLHLLSPSLRVVLVELAVHRTLHLLLALLRLRLHIAIALLLWRHILGLRQGWIDEGMRLREGDLRVCWEQVVRLEILPYFLTDVWCIAGDQEQVWRCSGI